PRSASDECYRLKVNFQTELDVAALVLRGVVQVWTPFDRLDKRSAGRIRVVTHNVEIVVIQDVEELTTELHVDALGDLQRLVDREIKAPVVRATECISLGHSRHAWRVQSATKTRRARREIRGAANWIFVGLTWGWNRQIIKTVDSVRNRIA